LLTKEKLEVAMIRDAFARTEISKDWTAVRRLRELSSGSMTPGGFVAQAYPDGFFNLALVLAYSVLDQVLKQAIIEDKFACDVRATLGLKMKKSRPNVRWANYDLVRQGKNARNDLVHEAEVAGIEDCRRFIAAVEAELTAWGL
jgi:hypothetical protein